MKLYALPDFLLLGIVLTIPIALYGPFAEVEQFWQLYCYGMTLGIIPVVLLVPKLIPSQDKFPPEYRLDRQAAIVIVGLILFAFCGCLAIYFNGHLDTSPGIIHHSKILKSERIPKTLGAQRGKQYYYRLTISCWEDPKENRTIHIDDIHQNWI